MYRRMKLAVIKASGPKDVFSPLKQGKRNSLFESRDWESVYEGLPNTVIKGAEAQEHGAIVTLQSDDGSPFERKVAGLEYVVGRRGSLQYLDDGLQAEVLGHDGGIVGDAASISGLTLRAKVDENLEVAPDVFVIGSLTGDSLVRFAFGGCVYAAREMIRRKEKASPLSLRTMDGNVTPDAKSSKNAGGYHKAAVKEGENASLRANGHTDLCVDRKERKREYFDLDVDVDGDDSAFPRKDGASLIDLEVAWRESVWWAGDGTLS